MSTSAVEDCKSGNIYFLFTTTLHTKNFRQRMVGFFLAVTEGCHLWLQQSGSWGPTRGPEGVTVHDGLWLSKCGDVQKNTQT